MNQVFASLYDNVDDIAALWLNGLDRDDVGDMDADRAAGMVRELFNPLGVYAKDGKAATDVAEEAADCLLDAGGLDGYRRMLSECSSEDVALSLDLLAETAVRALRGAGLEESHCSYASDLLRTYCGRVARDLRDDPATKSVDDHRTMELIKASQLLHSLFQGSRNAVFFLNVDKKIIDANKCAQQMFDRPLERFLGQSVRLLFPAEARSHVDELLSGLTGQEQMRMEGEALRAGQASFPVEITAAKVLLAEETCLYYMIIVDKSEYADLVKDLEHGRRQLREMSVTLKNVIKSVDNEKKEYRRSLAHNVEIELVPTLDKMAREQSEDVRDDFREVIEDNIRSILGGGGGVKGFDSLSLKLTPTELKVCKYIQVGHGTKEIADMLNSSFETVQTHRKNIRKKLKLTGQNVSLFNFLRSLASDDDHTVVG